MRIFLFCLLLVTMAAFASAADLSGKWNGNIEVKTPDGELHTMPAWAELAQKGQEVTGTAGGGDSDESMPIQKVSFDGKTLAFEVTGPVDGRVYKAKLDLTGEHTLDGTLDFALEDGTKLSGKFTLKREAKPKQ